MAKGPIVVPTEAYPLVWPVGVKRTVYPRQSNFGKNRTVGQSLDEVRREPAPVDATTLADRGPSRLPPSGPPPEQRDVAAQTVALRPRREVLEERAAIVVRTKQPRRVIEGAKVRIGPPAPVDDSPLPCVPVDLAAIGGSSFDIGRAWGGGRGGKRPSPATATSRDERREGDEP